MCGLEQEVIWETSACFTALYVMDAKTRNRLASMLYEAANRLSFSRVNPGMPESSVYSEFRGSEPVSSFPLHIQQVMEEEAEAASATKRELCRRQDLKFTRSKALMGLGFL